MHTQLTVAPASIDGEPIDRRIRRLVGALNQIPGITTFSSCGGHRKRDNVGQEPADQFHVSFLVSEKRVGWQALELLVNACDEVRECLAADLVVIAWCNDGELCWNLGGRGCHPDYLAQMIERGLGAEWVDAKS